MKTCYENGITLENSKEPTTIVRPLLLTLDQHEIKYDLFSNQVRDQICNSSSFSFILHNFITVYVYLHDNYDLDVFKKFSQLYYNVNSNQLQNAVKFYGLSHHQFKSLEIDDMYGTIEVLPSDMPFERLIVTFLGRYARKEITLYDVYQIQPFVIMFTPIMRDILEKKSDRLDKKLNDALAEAIYLGDLFLSGTDSSENAEVDDPNIEDPATMNSEDTMDFVTNSESIFEEGVRFFKNTIETYNFLKFCEELQIKDPSCSGEPARDYPPAYPNTSKPKSRTIASDFKPS